MTFPPVTLGSLLALVVLILALVLMIIGHLPVIMGGLLVALAIARLS